MAKLPSGGYPTLYAYENYLAQQLPVRPGSHPAPATPQGKALCS
jgi:hypothetical protein